MHQEINFKSNFLQELSDRGFISQITNTQELDRLLTQEKIAAYIGFDCTAESLHVGSLIQIMMLRLLQKHGHKPIALLGGGTTKIGDPSGKDEARKILTEEKIAQNLNGIKNTLAKFIKFDNAANRESAAIIVNNDEWLKDLNYIKFLRDVGRHFSVNRMLTFDSVKIRLERDQPLSFLEFNYMILQAYDFYKLNKEYGCRLQIGGSDQWGNIVNGVELTRRIAAAENDNSFDNLLNSRNKEADEKSNIFGLTSQLLTTSDGKKMGKTADGAVWLDSSMLSPYDYFQFFRNTHDADVIKFIKLFTDLEVGEIDNLSKFKDQEINKAKEILAYEATKICHGQEAANHALNKAREIFVAKTNNSFEIKKIDFTDSIRLVEVIKATGVVDSNNESKRLIQGGAVKIDSTNISDINHFYSQDSEFDIAIGKKKFFKIILRKI